MSRQTAAYAYQSLLLRLVYHTKDREKLQAGILHENRPYGLEGFYVLRASQSKASPSQPSDTALRTDAGVPSSQRMAPKGRPPAAGKRA